MVFLMKRASKPDKSKSKPKEYNTTFGLLKETEEEKEMCKRGASCSEEEKENKDSSMNVDIHLSQRNLNTSREMSIARIHFHSRRQFQDQEEDNWIEVINEAVDFIKKILSNSLKFSQILNTIKTYFIILNRYLCYLI